MKKSITLVLCLALVALFNGCGPDRPATPDSAPEAWRGNSEFAATNVYLVSHGWVMTHCVAIKYVVKDSGIRLLTNDGNDICWKGEYLMSLKPLDLAKPPKLSQPKAEKK